MLIQIFSNNPIYKVNKTATELEKQLEDIPRKESELDDIEWEYP